MSFQPKIVTFACQFCATRAVELDGRLHREAPPGVTVITVPCGGRVDIIHMLRAFERGADGVLITACKDGNCHYLVGNTRVGRRVEAVKAILAEIGLSPDRIGYYQLCMDEGPYFGDIAREMVDRVRALGPSPVTTGQGEELVAEQTA